MTTSAVELTEPARAALISLAADVVGRLPADEVPASLRSVAKFTPGKRHRLGGTALAAALDGDDGFREAVGRVVEATSPDLVAALRDGSDTAAADPVDLALIAYLTRPPGWRDALAAANARWLREREHTTNNRAEVAALRAEIGELRARARGEAARTRDAVAAARDSADAELAETRKALRDRTRELRQAERDRDAALESAAGLRAQFDAQAVAQDAEARRQRGRLADAERAAEAARRGSRAERDVDDARLWLLVDTLVQAATAVRRELSLAAPAVRPADTVGSAAGPSSPRSAADPGALDRVLALPNVHLVVDGYNVTKTGYGELSLAEQRTRLIGALAALAAQTGAEVTLAFDGGAKPPAQPPTPRGVRVLFSAPDETADDLIRRLVGAEPAGRPVVVVSSDRQVATDTGRAGAWTAPSAVLLARLG
jgi:predicted RNA-binding protein with PIN domain